jgi:hypothetical protein
MTAFHQAGPDLLRAFTRHHGGDVSTLSPEPRAQYEAIERLLETEEVVMSMIHQIGSAAKRLSIAMDNWRSALKAVNE